MSTIMRTTGELIDRQGWLDPLGDALQRLVRGSFAAGERTGRRVADVLNGTWLGHPLHPVLTDVPVGAWTVAQALDTVEALGGPKELGAGADAAIGAGLVAAVPTVLSGLADWQHLIGHERRTGLVHALLNAGAGVLYGAALVLRLRGQRETGRVCSLLGFGALTAGAYLGGELVFGLRVGVNRAAGQVLPSDWTPVLAEAELPEGQARRVEVHGVRVLLARQAGRVYAIGEVCSHLGGPLAEGRLEDGSVVCPWHGSRFSLEDGRVLGGPASFPEPWYEVRVRGGQIEVRGGQR